MPYILYDNDNNDSNEEVFNDLKIGKISYSIPCAAHTLHLAVDDFLKNTNESFINKVRDLVKLLRAPNHKVELSQKNLRKPFIDVVTRWNSIYNILDRLLTLKDYFNNESNCKKIFHSSHWITILEMIKMVALALERSFNSIQELQLPLGDFVKIWWELKLNVKSMQTYYSIMLFEILEQLLMNNDTLLSSLFLDPRLRKLLSLEKINRAKMYLRRFCNQLFTTTNPSHS